MNVSVEEVDGTLTLAIPKDIVASLHLVDGSVIDISAHEGGVLLCPIDASRPTLDELISQITEENRHEETDFGPPVGREIW